MNTNLPTSHGNCAMADRPVGRMVGWVLAFFSLLMLTSGMVAYLIAKILLGIAAAILAFLRP